MMARKEKYDRRQVCIISILPACRRSPDKTINIQ